VPPAAAAAPSPVLWAGALGCGWRAGAISHIGGASPEAALLVPVAPSTSSRQGGAESSGVLPLPAARGDHAPHGFDCLRAFIFLADSPENASAQDRGQSRSCGKSSPSRMPSTSSQSPY
jgi:hypothetical protein